MGFWIILTEKPIWTTKWWGRLDAPFLSNTVDPAGCLPAVRSDRVRSRLRVAGESSLPLLAFARGRDLRSTACSFLWVSSLAGSCSTRHVYNARALHLTTVCREAEQSRRVQRPQVLAYPVLVCTGERA